MWPFTKKPEPPIVVWLSEEETRTVAGMLDAVCRAEHGGHHAASVTMWQYIRAVIRERLGDARANGSLRVVDTSTRDRYQVIVDPNATR